MALDFVPRVTDPTTGQLLINPATGQPIIADEQFLQITGPDGLITGFQYDLQQRTLYFKESQVIYPSFHGATHIAQDPVPEATSDTRGLMSAADKTKLDSMVGTRIGVLGFMGAGFPDDGGWMQSDIILAAGTEFISLERIGNVIRFTVDSPIPLNCSQEACAQIYWTQDETDVAAIRPPACGGKLPGLNGYGELKIYVFPESAIVDPNNPAAKLNQKGSYPSLTFTRYENSITPGTAEFECVLQRDSYNTLQAQVGWAMTPGPAQVPEMVWFMGKDTNNNQIRFDLNAETTPGLLGSLLYNGNLITKRTAVITSYTSNIVNLNQYYCKWWDVENHKAVGSHFVATNVWQYTNPESVISNYAPQQLVLDASISLLPVGTLVDITYFKVGDVAGTPINHYYFQQQPRLTAANLWTEVAAIQFGDMQLSRLESPTPGQTNPVLDTRSFESQAWGLTDMGDALILYPSYNQSGANAAILNWEPSARLDPSLPGLVIQNHPNAAVTNFDERPVYLWHRQELSNALIRVELGRPELGSFRPLDVILGGAIDTHTNIFMQVQASFSTFGGRNAIRVRGCRWQDLPPQGAVRCISTDFNGEFSTYNTIFNYNTKLLWTDLGTGFSMNEIVLVAPDGASAYMGTSSDIVELLHQEYNAPCARIEFIPANDALHSIALQVKVGQLDMSVPYETEIAGTWPQADYVRGMAPGYTVSQLYSQAASYSGVGAAPAAVPPGFVMVDGGSPRGGTQSEYWNYLDILLRDDEVWIWWNNLIVPPNTTLSAQLPTPVGVTTPYYPLPRSRRFGKIGLRMWPGTKLRSMSIRTQLKAFSEFSYGQLTVG